MRRLWHRLYAWANGYFWLPCPLCGRPFGGHEWDAGNDVLVVESGPATFAAMSDGETVELPGWHEGGVGVCRDCGPAARRRNRRRDRACLN